MARSPFSLCKRKTAYASRRSYYVRFRHPETHQHITGRSIARLVELMDLDPGEYAATSKAAVMAKRKIRVQLSSGKSSGC
jgi:hypothetical protein